MRLLAMVLITLATLGFTAAPGEARSRSDQAQVQSRQQTTTTRASAARASAAPQRQAATRTASHGRAAAQGGRDTRHAATRSGGRGQASAACRGRNCGTHSRTVSWQGGLEPPTHAQATTCPSGTLATLAHGHTDIVRCMPL